MPFVDYEGNNPSNAVKGTYHSQQRQGQPFLDDTDPKVIAFLNRVDPDRIAIEQGKANARNANSLPALIQALKDAGVI